MRCVGPDRASCRTATAVAAVIWLAGTAGASALHAQDPSTPPTSLDRALPPSATGAQIFEAACSTCHAPDGAGSPESVVGFSLPLPNGHGFPDFRDCATNTVEPASDWVAVVTRGGPIRGLDRHMPAFGDALSADQIQLVVNHVRSFCVEPAWPRGDLNLPRAFFVEKAFPENETIWATGVTGGPNTFVDNVLIFERRIGTRGTYEVRVPFDAAHTGTGEWVRGLGDTEVAVRRTFYASAERGTIFAAGGEVILPTGKETLGLGTGTTIWEPFALGAQTLGANGFVQVHAGLEFPVDQTKASREAFLRTAVGYTIAADQGFGRAWTPMAEVLVARPKGGATEWDVVPQMQVSLSRRQHILVNAGVRLPVNDRAGRPTQILTYFLWDWFDGGLREGWR
jgi:mono/diheme cytochrome c family protein